MAFITQQIGEMDTASRKAEALQFLKLLDLQYIAVRTLPNSREQYGDWTEVEKLADAVVALSPQPPTASDIQGVFVVVNNLDEQAYLDFANGQGDGKAVADRHISRRTNFYVDIDPTRFGDEGGKGAANEKEREWAHAALEQILTIAALYGFSEPVVIDSGNGYQVHFRIDLPNDDESKSIIKSVLEAFARLIDCDQGHVDTSVCNAARLARIPGSWNRKGKGSPDRPFRLARIVKVPESGMLSVTDVSVLRAFGELGGLNTKSSAKPKRPANAARRQLDPETFEALIEEVSRYLSDNDAPPVVQTEHGNTKTVLTFAHCPFRGEAHTDGDAGVLVRRNGQIGFKCFHNKCADRTWPRLQKLLGPRFYSATLAAYAGKNSGKMSRHYSDPLLLARAHFDRTRLGDGGQSLVFLQGQMYRYVPNKGWREVSSRELQAPVRETIQQVFDAQAIINPRLRFSPQVTTTDIAGAVKALDSIAYHEIDPTMAPPFWLEKDQQSDPLNLLVLRNGVLDLMGFVDGREHFFPSTSKLFTMSVGDYDFAPEKRNCPVWLSFLDSLEQDAMWNSLLQEIMGCTLCAGFDLQKIFMLIGPPRCGKGTITRTLESILGRQNVCSPNLIDFAKPFGLEQTLGTRLAIVPEVAFPPRDTQQIVATLKAISGGDLVTVDRKFIKNIPVRLPMKIMLVTNNFIALPDNSKALPSRVVPLRFTTSFLGKEDITLGRRLLDERSAILNWSLEGFCRLVQSGGQFTLPPSSREMMEQLHLESAPLQSFIQEQCILDPYKAVYKQSLYECYKSWMKSNDPDRPLLTKSDFKRELMSAASQVMPKRTSSRDLNQSTYTVVATVWDAKIEDRRPEAWVGIYCRSS
jgi:P4 family phage/plasmid primase-like protien